MSLGRGMMGERQRRRWRALVEWVGQKRENPRRRLDCAAVLLIASTPAATTVDMLVRVVVLRVLGVVVKVGLMHLSLLGWMGRRRSRSGAPPPGPRPRRGMIMILLLPPSRRKKNG